MVKERCHNSLLVVAIESPPMSNRNSKDSATGAPSGQWSRGLCLRASEGRDAWPDTATNPAMDELPCTVWRVGERR
jgi:hypothetical protein